MLLLECTESIMLSALKLYCLPTFFCLYKFYHF